MWPHLQHDALVKVVCAGPSLKGGESYVSSSEWRDITEFICTQGSPLIISWANVGLSILPIGLPTRGAVILVRQPGPILICALVDGEALRPTGVEFQSYIGYLKSLPCGKYISLCLTLNGITERITAGSNHCSYTVRSQACYVRDKYCGVIIWSLGAEKKKKKNIIAFQKEGKQKRKGLISCALCRVNECHSCRSGRIPRIIFSLLRSCTPEKKHRSKGKRQQLLCFFLI